CDAAGNVVAKVVPSARTIDREEWIASAPPPLTAEEIERIKLGPGAGWSDRDAALIRAADELHADQFITDATWAELQSFLSDQQCMAVVFTVAQYTQVSMFLNTLGVQLDPDQSLDPDLKFY
ncbi:MAG: carboxymuconolactone decarboxylase family protein, partial [Phenylobacterium sp.]